MENMYGTTMLRRSWKSVLSAVCSAALVTTAASAQDFFAQSTPAIEPDLAAEIARPNTGVDAGADPIARMAELEKRLAELESSIDEKLTSSPPEPAKSDPAAMKGAWGKNGFEAATSNGNFKTHIGGRVQVDAIALQDSDLVLRGVGTDDAVNFRRARFRIDGTMYKRMTWAAEFDWVNGFNTDPTGPPSPVNAQGGNVALIPALTDMWLALGEVPWVGNVKIGNQKEPIGLEHINSSRFLDFIERSYLQDAFYGPFNNGFSPGISLYNWTEDENVTATIGAYKNTQNIFAYDTGDNEYALAGRLTAVPWAANEDEQLVHLGCAASYRGLDQDAAVTAGNTRIRSRGSLRNGPPSGLNPSLADTNFSGRLFCDNETLLAPEIAIVDGPWHWQAEYVAAFRNGTTFTPIGGAPTDVGQVFTQGQYVQALYFLTGEHREYERHEARFGRVVPRRNLHWNSARVSDWGAWQIGARYGFLDLNDGATGVGGGYIQDFTVGLNWFWNPFSKMQFNYVHQRVENTQRDAQGNIATVNDGTLDGFGVRCAFDF